MRTLRILSSEFTALKDSSVPIGITSSFSVREYFVIVHVLGCTPDQPEDSDEGPPFETGKQAAGGLFGRSVLTGNPPSSLLSAQDSMRPEKSGKERRDKERVSL